MRQRNHLGAIVAIGLLVGVLLGGHSPAITAQNATPAAGAATTGGDANHPAHIHRGTCANLDPAPLYPLANLTMGAADAPATPMAGAMASMLGVSSAVPVASSVTVVEVGLADLLGGTVRPGEAGSAGDLLIGLSELNQSGVTGIAWLHDNGNGTTTVIAFVAQGLAAGGATDGAATPTT